MFKNYILQVQVVHFKKREIQITMLVGVQDEQGTLGQTQTQKEKY